MVFRVETEDLGKKAHDIDVELSGMPKPDDSVPNPPSSHPVSILAAGRLHRVSANPKLAQDRGVREGKRLAASLRAVQQAYEQVDVEYARAMDPDSHITVTTAPVAPLPKVLLPLHSEHLNFLKPEPFKPEDAQPPKRQGLLNSGDQGSGFDAAATKWENYATSITNSIPVADTRDVNWEGSAADEAFLKFREYRDWMGKLAEAWTKLAGEAKRMSEVHKRIHSAHEVVADEWAQRYMDGVRLMSSNDPGAAAQLADVGKDLARLQKESDELIQEYARDMSAQHIDIEEPPDSGIAPTPVARDPNAVPWVDPTSAPADHGSSGMGGSGGGGGGDTAGSGVGGAPATGEPAVSPMSADPNAGKQAQAGSSGSGGSPSGGSPSGSGAPSGAGGGAPSGMPGGLPGGNPDLPKIGEPSLKPASAGGGGSPGGGGGGGMPSAPLGPAVGAETVAASPSGARGAAPTGGPPAGAGGGGMGGGMGGMGHGAGQGQGQGKEKRRDPNLTPDEDLYIEDRAYTDPVIGHRPRGRKAPDGKDAS